MASYIETVVKSIQRKIEFEKELYQETIKGLDSMIKQEVDYAHKIYDNLIKNSSSAEIAAENKRERDELIEYSTRELYKEKAYQEKCLKNAIRQIYKEAMVELLEEEIDPSAIYPLIKKAGFNPDELYDEILQEKEEEYRKELKKIFYSRIEEAFLDYSDLTPEQTVAWFNKMSNDEVEVDEALVIEAYNEVKQSYIEKYKVIVKNAAEIMVDNLAAGTEYVNKQENITLILSVSDKTLDDCIAEAKDLAKKMKSEKLKNAQGEWERTNNKIKEAYKKINTISLIGLALLVLGAICLSLFLIIVGVCLMVITYFKNKQVDKLQQKLEVLVAENQDLKVDSSGCTYKLPIVIKCFNLIKEKIQKKNK